MRKILSLHVGQQIPMCGLRWAVSRAAIFFPLPSANRGTGCLLSPGGNGPEPQRVAAPLTLDILGGLRFAPLSLAKGGAFSSRRLLIFLNRPLAQHRILAFQTCEEAVLLPPSKR